MGAKMLYGEIRALTISKGFCWASDEHLAEPYKVTTRTVRAWVAALEEAGFIIVEHAKNQNGQRKIWLEEAARKETSAPGRNIPSRPEENFQAYNKEEELEDEGINTPLTPRKTKVKRNAIPQHTLTEHLEAHKTSVGADGIPGEWWEYAASLGWTGEQIDFEWRGFQRYWNGPDAKAGGRKKDWPATWQNRIDQQSQRRTADSRRGYSAGSQSRGGIATAFAASVARRYGVPSSDGGIGGGQDASGTGENAGDGGSRLPVGELPF
ncbi:helix-turn-helix domain-containing protein [Jiella pelagia]|nr:helix-turn-helix domain-containing protein [Jiella pelagia]